MKFYIIKQNSLWGDYGSILAHGMAAHLPRRRPAPTGTHRAVCSAVDPPRTGAIVVTQAARERMERREIPGVSFLPVLKARIVEYHWEHWDRSLAAPVEYPEGGEPEGYILDRPHSPAFAEQLPEFWEVTLPQDASLKSVRVGAERTTTSSTQASGKAPLCSIRPANSTFWPPRNSSRFWRKSGASGLLSRK